MSIVTYSHFKFLVEKTLVERMLPHWKVYAESKNCSSNSFHNYSINSSAISVKCAYFYLQLVDRGVARAAFGIKLLWAYSDIVEIRIVRVDREGFHYFNHLFTRTDIPDAITALFGECQK